MSGVIPSKEFNEQIKKTVRESLRRQRGNQPRQGRWHKKSGIGGTNAIIRFTIDTVDEDCEFCNATVNAVACNLSPPSVGDSIAVYDGLGCILDVPPADVIGLKGYAVKMDVPDDEGYEDCRWEILNLCCSEV